MNSLSASTTPEHTVDVQGQEARVEAIPALISHDTDAGNVQSVTAADLDDVLLQCDDVHLQCNDDDAVSTQATTAIVEDDDSAALLDIESTPNSSDLNQTGGFHFDRLIACMLPVCSVVFGVSEVIIVMLLNYDQSAEETLLAAAYPCVRMLCLLFSIIVIVIGFCLSTRFRSKHTGYNSSTALFLLCTFCLFVFDVFRIVADVGVQAGSHSNDPSLPDIRNNTAYTMVYSDVTRGVIMTGNILDLLHVFLQTSFLLHIIQLTPVGSNWHITSEQYRLFKSVLIYLFLKNGFDWIRVSFVTDKSGSSGLWLLNSYFPNYALILWHFIVPVAAFYCLQSFMCFLLLYIQL